MTEERFEQIIEDAADRFDKSVNHAWRRHRPLRFICKAISFGAGAGLMASAIPLAEKGNRAAANICLVSGGVVIACGILQQIIFKKS